MRGDDFIGGCCGPACASMNTRPRFQHAKMALIDDWVAVGSSNLDRWNLRWNLRPNQEIDAPDFGRRDRSDVRNGFQRQSGISHPHLGNGGPAGRA